MTCHDEGQESRRGMCGLPYNISKALAANIGRLTLCSHPTQFSTHGRREKSIALGRVHGDTDELPTYCVVLRTIALAQILQQTRQSPTLLLIITLCFNDLVLKRCS